MSSILIATDYSEAGNNAAHYALNLAGKLGCSLKVLHTYMLPIVTADQPFPLLSVRDMEIIAKERMDALLSEFPTTGGVDITDRITYGDWRDAAAEEGKDAILLVVGNDGDTDTWLGSNTLDAARTSGKPLLAIPAGTSYAAPATICLSCDAASMQDLAQLHSLLPLLRITGATLLLVHIKINSNDYSTWNEAAIENILSGIPFSCHQVEAIGGSIDDSIHQFAVEHNADWLAIIPHKHSLFHGLFGKSHTRAALQMGDLPVLSIH